MAELHMLGRFMAPPPLLFLVFLYRSVWKSGRSAGWTLLEFHCALHVRSAAVRALFYIIIIMIMIRPFLSSQTSCTGEMGVPKQEQFHITQWASSPATLYVIK